MFQNERLAKEAEIRRVREEMVKDNKYKEIL